MVGFGLRFCHFFVYMFVAGSALIALSPPVFALELVPMLAGWTTNDKTYFKEAEPACKAFTADKIIAFNNSGTCIPMGPCGPACFQEDFGVEISQPGSAACMVQTTYQGNRGTPACYVDKFKAALGFASFKSYACPANSAHNNASTCICSVGYAAVDGKCVKHEIDLPESCRKDGYATTNPIVPATGEKHYTEVDYADTGVHPLSLVRSYRSRWATGQTQSFYNALGQTWSHNYAAGLSFFGGTAQNTGSNAISARIEYGNGTTLGLTWNSALGGWKAVANASTLIATTAPVAGYLLSRAEDDSRWQFDSAGKVLSVTARNGWVTTYTYSTTISPTTIVIGRVLVRVTNHFGRSLNFNYANSGQLTSVSTPDGQAVSYAFDSASRLNSVNYPGNVS